MKITRLIGLILLVAGQVCYASSNVYEQVVLYPSIDQYGDSLMLSGKVSVPVVKSPKGIILWPHHTISANKEAPSVGKYGAVKDFSEDYVLVLPDYIGYGVTKALFHPYLHGALTAQNCVDMLPAALKILDSLQIHPECDSLYIVGYSQGGASALWTLRLLEEQYADRVHIKKCFIGGGPYDVASTYDVAISHEKTIGPFIIPLLAMGTSVAYDLQLPRELILTPAMNRRFEKEIASKKYGLLELYLRMPNHKISHWLSDYGRDKTQPHTRRMYEGFLKSSFVHYPMDTILGEDSICPSWIPTAPVYVFHSTADDLVPFQNALHLQRLYKDVPTITWDFSDQGGHVKALRVFTSLLKELIKE